MKKMDVVQTVLKESRTHNLSLQREKSMAFAPLHVALCHSWGRRNAKLNLPVNSSLSVSLGDIGARTQLSIRNQSKDIIKLNGNILVDEDILVKRIISFLDLFRVHNPWFLEIDIQMNCPPVLNLESCQMASIVLALNELFDWKLADRELSILARLADGEATRSLWSGFVEWHAGAVHDGMDSYSESLTYAWPALCAGFLMVNNEKNEKEKIAYPDAMERTQNSSVLYESWSRKAAGDLAILKQALKIKNFSLLAGAMESNSLTMHATMLGAWPPICYLEPPTIQFIQQIWDLRKSGVEVYFNQSFNPNLIIFFLNNDIEKIKKVFKDILIVKIFK